MSVWQAWLTDYTESCVFPQRLRDDSLSYGVKRQFRNALQVQLLHDVGPMSLHRVYTQVQKVCNVFVRFSLRHELKNLPFARSQQIVRVLRAGTFQLAHVVVQKDFAHSRAKE